MSKIKYKLEKGEKIVYKVSEVKRGFWGLHTDVLLITNKKLVWEKYSSLGFYKGSEELNYNQINQAIKGTDFNGCKCLELYTNNKKEEFSILGNEEELDVLIEAINDQIEGNSEFLDYKYYENKIRKIKDKKNEEKDLKRLAELKQYDDNDINASSGMGFVGAAAKNILKSGDYSIKGIAKGIGKTSSKKKKKGAISGFFDELLDDMGIKDLQDEFTEMGNDIREEFGMKHKMTNAEKKELEELEAKYKKQQHKKTQKAPEENQNTKNDKLQKIKEAKEMLDAGILTEEEFAEIKAKLIKEIR